MIIPVLILLLAGCATEISPLPQIAPSNDFCKIYKPILPSRKDTEETAKHVFKYHEIWNKKCHNNS